MASASSDGSWAFLDLLRGVPLVTKHSRDSHGDLDSAAPSYTCSRFHPDGLLLANGASDGSVRIWDIREQKSAANCSEQAGGGAVLAVSFSENGYLFAAGGEGGSTHIWDLRKLKAVQSLPSESRHVVC